MRKIEILFVPTDYLIVWTGFLPALYTFFRDCRHFSVSEPAVIVLGSQIEDITNGHIKKMTIIVTLAIGIGFASLLSILKILTQLNILYFLVPLYVIAIVMMKFTPKLFVGLAFDSGGVTGGALTSAFLTPLTLSIAQSVANLSNGAMSILTNGFGIISFISVTPIIAIQALGIIYDIRSKKASKELAQESFDDLQRFIDDGADKQVKKSSTKKVRIRLWKKK